MKGDSAPISTSDRDTEKRLTVLEEGVKRSDALMDRQLRTLTIIFSVMSGLVAVFGILITILGVISKNEVATAIREMERKFEILSGQALKMPILTVLYEGVELNQRTISARVDPNGVFKLSPFQLKNIGDRGTESISVRLYFARRTETLEPHWQETTTTEKGFPSAFFWGGPYHISPNETWTGPPFQGKVSGDLPKEIRSKIHVFYGRERPAEATFTIQLTK